MTNMAKVTNMCETTSSVSSRTLVHYPMTIRLSAAAQQHKVCTYYDMARRLNEFLVDAFENRQTLLANSLDNSDVDQLKDVVSGLTERTERLRNDRFQNNLDTIVSCVAFRRSCGMGVGKWLGIHCRQWSQRKRSKITELCKLSAGVFKNWDCIVHNLTNSAMSEIDARDFTIRKFYNARNQSWCLAEKRQSMSDKSAAKPEDSHQEYEETKYENILEYIKHSQVLDDVNFDSSQADLIADRLKDDLHKLCKKAIEGM